MLSELARELPHDEGFLYEPKWDGFRTIVFRDGEEVELGSRNERPLTRYFPELLSPLRAQLPARCVVDGELVISTGPGLDFDALLQRIHPAASRVALLARETPASLVIFDCLALDDRDLRPLRFGERRALLEARLGALEPPLHLTPATRDRALALHWFEKFEGAGLDGVMAKPLSLVYQEGKRVMLKVKHERTADCVVGGFRLHKDGKGVGSLLLGLYDDQRVLHHVGVATSFAAAQRRALLLELEPLRSGASEGHPWSHSFGEGDLQRIPGGPSRWTAKRDLSWEPLRPERVVEVSYDHLQGTRFRHATHLRRWRPDREPSSCTYAQLEVVLPEEMQSIFRSGR
jgi:ATP-dependent DNA ligase